MSKLLSAGLVRMRKSKMFYVGIIFMIVISVFIVLVQYSQADSLGAEGGIDGIFFVNVHIIGIFIAAFCSLFVGREYSDGTIRNKLVVGQRRSVIYFSTLLINIISSLIVYFTYAVIILALGTPLLGFFESDFAQVIKYLLVAILVDVAWCAIFTLISMMIQNKTVVAIVSTVGFFVLFFTVVSLSSALSQPEVWESYVTVEENGEVVDHPEEPNPYYVDGTKRDVYEFLMDFLPSGQALQASVMFADNYWRLIAFSSSIIIVTTACGVFFFRKKDLK